MDIDVGTPIILTSVVMPLVRLMRMHGVFSWDQREEIAEAIQKIIQTYERLKNLDDSREIYATSVCEEGGVRCGD